MLTEVSIEGFQGFGSKQTIRLAPITLIFGENSSGKSAIFRALMFLTQNLRAMTPDSMEFKSRQRSVDLVSFQNISFRHLSQDIKFQITMTRDSMSLGKFEPVYSAGHQPELEGGIAAFSRISIELVFSGLEKRITNVGFVGYRENEQLQFRLQVEPEIYRVTELTCSDDNILNALRNIIEPLIYDSSTDLNIAIPDLSQKDLLLVIGKSDRHSRIRGEHYPSNLKPEEIGFNTFAILSIIKSLLFNSIRNFERVLDGTRHIGPIREIPDRLVIGDVEDAPRRRPFGIWGSSRVELRRNDSKRSEISAWVEKLTAGQFSLEKITSPIADPALAHLGEVSAWVLTDMRTDTRVSFKDVGVGLSQLLPVIVEVVDIAPMRRRMPSLLLVEQPELHLHPKLQGDVLDMFIEGYSQDVNRQVLAETHSEQMILRLQRRIREGIIQANNVSVIFVESDSVHGSKVQELQIDDDGVIDEWPTSFSDLRFKEILD